MLNRILGSTSRKKVMLPAALALVLALVTNAGYARVPTRTHAAINMQKNAATPTSTVIMKGYPIADATEIMPMEQSRQLHIVVDLNRRNTEKLKKYLQDVSQPGNPSYQEFLTREQFKAEFAPTDAQVLVVVAYLESSGFTHIRIAPNNMLISADGTAMSVDAAFNADMKTFNLHGKQYFANASDVTVPQSLGGIVQSVLGLQSVAMARVMPKIVPDNVVAPRPQQ